MTKFLWSVFAIGEIVNFLCCVMFFSEQNERGETVVLLSPQKADDTIEINLDLDELDATSAKLKATYQEIKEYVLKNFDL